MEYDEIIDCPKSGGDLCYKLEVTKEITNYFSLNYIKIYLGKMKIQDSFGCLLL